MYALGAAESSKRQRSAPSAASRAERNPLGANDEDRPVGHGRGPHEPADLNAPVLGSGGRVKHVEEAAVAANIDDPTGPSWRPIVPGVMAPG